MPALKMDQPPETGEKRERTKHLNKRFGATVKMRDVADEEKGLEQEKEKEDEGGSREQRERRRHL